MKDQPWSYSQTHPVAIVRTADDLSFSRSATAEVLERSMGTAWQRFAGEINPRHFELPNYRPMQPKAIYFLDANFVYHGRLPSLAYDLTE